MTTYTAPSAFALFAAVTGDVSAATMTAVGAFSGVIIAYIFSRHLENVGYEEGVSESSFFGAVVVIAMMVSVRMTITYLGH